MSEQPPGTVLEKPKRGRVRRIVFWILAAPILGFVLLILMGMFVGVPGLTFLWVLFTGWIDFLIRTVPRITLNWDLLAMGFLCGFVIVLGSQRVLRWVVNSIATARGANWHWRWKWTISAVLGAGLLFLVGMAVGGATHQIGWLSSQPGPWFEPKGGDFFEMRMLENDLRQAMIEKDADVESVRTLLHDSGQSYLGSRRGEPPLIQRLHVLLIINDSKKVDGAILFHRDVGKREQREITYWFDGDSDRVPAAKLPELIQKHQGHLIAL